MGVKITTAAVNSATPRIHIRVDAVLRAIPSSASASNAANSKPPEVMTSPTRIVRSHRPQRPKYR